MIANHRGCGGVCEQNDYIMDGYWICSRCGEIVDGNDLGSWWDNTESIMTKVANVRQIHNMLPDWRVRAQQNLPTGIERDLVSVGIRIEDLPIELQDDVKSLIQQEHETRNLLKQRDTLLILLRALL
jgi:hypothetical protein